MSDLVLGNGVLRESSIFECSQTWQKEANILRKLVNVEDNAGEDSPRFYQ